MLCLWPEEGRGFVHVHFRERMPTSLKEIRRVINDEEHHDVMNMFILDHGSRV